MREDLYLIWLSRIDGIGVKKQKILLDMFGGGRDIFTAPKELLSQIPELSAQNINKIISSRNESQLISYDEELEEKQIQFISIHNRQYPELLKTIEDPPIGFYMIGEMPDENLIKVAVIGSRKCSEYGLTCGYKLSKDLAGQNVVIVSGMARGIDSMAHKGAIEGGGFTIAVLGCGVDICYPAENRGLREQIVKNGCVISEYPPGTQPLPGFFPVRNRIISGLSKAVIVVEAAKRSGTLITVDQALDQGRLVMAVPGNITSKLSQGTNDLLKDCAIPVTDYKDVLDYFGVFIEEDHVSGNNFMKSNHNSLESVTKEEKVIYECISLEPITFDGLIHKSNTQAQTLLYILTMLEIKGHIQALPGQRYIRSL